jgi:hypothetical protein
MLMGFAYVEVNERKRVLMIIKTSSGKGDPLSTILFLIATEPLLATAFMELMYTVEERVAVILYSSMLIKPHTPGSHC